MSIIQILIQITIAVVVVCLYHVWVSGKKQEPEARNPSPFVAPPPSAPAPAPVLAQAPVAAPPPPKPAPVLEQTAPEVMAVIAAAIAVVLGKPHRVVAVETAVAGPDINVWALEGRGEQFLSHKIR